MRRTNASLIFLIVCCCLGHLAEAEEEECGEYDENSKGAWPWLVTIFGDDVMQCVGTLVGPRKVLTAARCIDPESYNAKKWTVLLPNGENVDVAEIFMHKEYKQHSDNASDIGYLSLETNVEYDDNVKPACTMSAGEQEDMKHCKVVQVIPDIDDETGGGKQTIDAKQADEKACDNKVFKNNFKNTKDLICVDMDTNDEDSKGCSRANASPFYCLEDGRWFLSGIALSCGDKYMTTAKSSVAYFVDVCNCTSDMVSIGKDVNAGDDDEEDEDEGNVEEPVATQPGLENDEGLSDEKEDKKKEKEEKKKEKKKSKKDKKKKDKKKKD